MERSPTETTVAVDPRHVSYTHLMYGLHAAAIVIALLGSTLLGFGFVFSLPSIIAVVMNYMRRDEVRGTWLESHFRWQLRTFWITAVIVCFAWTLVFTIVLIPAVIAAYLLVGVWATYRTARGWYLLKEGRSAPNGWV